MNFKLLDFVQYILNLVLLFIILRAILYKPVKNFMKAREEKIKKQQDDASAALVEAQGHKEQYEALLNESSAQADRLMERSHEEAEKTAGDIVKQAQEQARRILEEAREKAAIERAEVLASIRGEAAGMSVGLAAKILAREVNAQDNARIIEDYFSKVG